MLARQEQAEVLQCPVRDIVIWPAKLVSNIFEPTETFAHFEEFNNQIRRHSILKVS